MSKEPDEMRMPGIGANRAIFCCTLYYSLVHVYQLLTSRQGTTLIVIILVPHPFLLLPQYQSFPLHVFSVLPASCWLHVLPLPREALMLYGASRASSSHHCVRCS